jgi:hypothetical protein
MSAGALEFCVVDAVRRTVEATASDGTRTYAAGEVVPVAMLDGEVAVDGIFSA